MKRGIGMFCKRKKSNLRPYVDESKIYRQIVKNYLKLTGRELISNLSDYCERKGNRLTYEEMEEVLGKHYPKAKWVNKSDRKQCVITFMEHTEYIYYKYDNNYVYFP